MAGRDPYSVLGVGASASNEELRAAYRRLVQLHHPDHNGGSAEAARRFEEVQDAYARVLQMRKTGGGAGGAGRSGDPEIDAQLADLERQVREAAEQARADARRAAADAVNSSAPRRPSDEELGYYKTDDSFSKWLDDAAAEVSKRFADTGSRPARKRLADLLDQVSEKLSGDRRPPEK